MFFGYHTASHITVRHDAAHDAAHIEEQEEIIREKQPTNLLGPGASECNMPYGQGLLNCDGENLQATPSVLIDTLEVA